MSPTIIWVSIIGFIFVVGFLYKKVQELTMASTKEIPLEDCVGHKDNVHVFIDFGIKDRFKDDLIGRVEFELFTNKLPLTCENFRCFITGEKGDGATGKPMHYKGVKFHRIIPVSCFRAATTSRATEAAAEHLRSVLRRRVAGRGTRQALASWSPVHGQQRTGNQRIAVFRHIREGEVARRKARRLRARREGHGASPWWIEMRCGTYTGQPLQNVIARDCGQLKSKSQ